MEEKKWTGKWNYVPGRTPEQLEDERRRKALNSSYEERYRLMMQLMLLEKTLRKARISNGRQQTP